MRQMICVSEVQRLDDVERHRMNQRWENRDHRFIRWYDFQWSLANGSLDAFAYLIPSPLTHLRLLDCVEVQRSARHLEDHIQSIQV
jgi:hypothetical protein